MFSTENFVPKHWSAPRLVLASSWFYTFFRVLFVEPREKLQNLIDAPIYRIYMLSLVSSPIHMSQKRPDIQGLRCICILMVLLYHYYPRIFPQGRLGVDMFFVISGFLIALMLSRKKDGVAAYFLQFYWRRVKRILPLCYLVFFLSYITMYQLHLDAFIPSNKSFGVRTLFFLANVKMSNEDQYETQLTGAKVLLTHYWSLSTEIQFYSFAPITSLSVLEQSPNRKTVSFIVLALISLSHYLTTSEAISFNSPLARLWQFLAGFIAYYNCFDEKSSATYAPLMIAMDDEKQTILRNIQKPRRENTDTKSRATLLLSYLSLFIVCSILFIPSPTFFLDTLFRVIVILSTMWTLMAVGKNPKFLEHPLSVFMGDISFSLYLVHWPILCFVKAYGVDIPCVSILNAPIAFALSMSFAVVLHEYSRNEKAIQLNYELNFRWQARHQRSKYAKPYKLKGFDKFDKYQKKRLTRMTGGTGNLTILIIGNSYTGNQQDLIFDGLKDIHNEIYIYQTSACEALVTTTTEKYQSFECIKNPMKNAEILELLKPDLLFIVERGTVTKYNLTSEVVLEDKHMQEIAKNMDVFQKFTKRIFILGSIRSLVPTPATRAIELFKKKKRLRDSPSLVSNDNVFQRIRFGKISEVCRKCVVYEWEHVFYNSTGDFVPYNPDTELLYFDNLMHLGEDGKKKIKPFYANLGKELMYLLLL